MATCKAPLGSTRRITKQNAANRADLLSVVAFVFECFLLLLRERCGQARLRHERTQCRKDPANPALCTVGTANDQLGGAMAVP